MRSTIICVDDDKFLLSTLADQLSEWFGKNYSVEKAISGEEALEILDDCIEQGSPVSVIISDYIMPVMRGDELLCKIHMRDKNIRNIMLTGYTQIDGIINAINNAGLYRFISKPWDKKDLMLTVIGALKSYEQDMINTALLQNYDNLNKKHDGYADNVIGIAAGVIDMRCGSALGHSLNVASISQKLGERAGLNADAVKNLRVMGAFHDIGKVALSEKDLLPVRKNEQLLYDNPSVIALQNETVKKLFQTNPQLDKNIMAGIYYHLEKYDGTGINSVKGADIPIESRIIAIANYYDILASGGASRKAAFERLYAWRGSVFDPDLLQTFISIDI